MQRTGPRGGEARWIARELPVSSRQALLSAKTRGKRVELLAEFAQLIRPTTLKELLEDAKQTASSLDQG